MRALRCQSPGDPRATLALVDVPEPELRAGELLVEVLASPISPMDRLMLRGLYPLGIGGTGQLGSGWLGTQGVGRVLALADDVVGPEPGTVVLLPVRCGAWRERLTVAADSVVALPAGRDPIGACTLRVEALSAAVLLDALEPGEWFVHSPGAGSVGRYLTSLARARGMRSIALVGSPEPVAELWRLGADHVLARDPGLATRMAELGIPEPRLAFDGSGGQTSALLGSCLRVGGELVVFGAMSRRPVELPVAQLVFRDIHVRGFWLHRWAQAVGPAELAARLEQLAATDLREHVIAHYDLDAFPEALARAELTRANGRIVFTPSPG